MSKQHRKMVGIAMVLTVFLVLSFVFSILKAQNEGLDREFSKFKAQKEAHFNNLKECLLEEEYMEINKVIESMTYNQLNLTVDGISKSIIQQIKLDNAETRIITDNDYRQSLLRRYLGPVRMYDFEGDGFAINSQFTFDLDDSEDCGQPKWDDGKPILDIAYRPRTFADEVCWQQEAFWLLEKFGLIDDKGYNKYETKPFNLDHSKYEKDTKINSLAFITASDIDYIKEKYPIVFSTFQKLKIVMHHDYSKAESVMKFFERVEDSDVKTNLRWEFNPPFPDGNPQEEALAIKWIPVDPYGFDDQNKNYSGGTPNQNYYKLGIAMGVQIGKIKQELKPIYDNLEKCVEEAESQKNRDIVQFSNLISLQKTNNIYNACFLAFFVTLMIIVSMYSYNRIPRQYDNSTS